MAAENERLRAALEASERERAELRVEVGTARRVLGEGAQREAAVGEVLRAMGRGPAAHQDVLDAIAERAARLCAADAASVYRVVSPREVAGPLRPHLEALNAQFRQWGRPAVRAEDRPRWCYLAARFALDGQQDVLSQPLFGVEENGQVFRGGATGRAIVDATTVHVPDAALLTEADGLPNVVRLSEHTGERTFLAVPLLLEGAAVGALLLRRREARAFAAHEIALVETFAAQAAVAIENARLFQELNESNRALTEQKQQLTEALEQQTATSEILRAIASSPADSGPVMEAILERARRLSGSTRALIRQYDGDRLTLSYNHSLLDSGERVTFAADPRAHEARGAARGAPMGALRVAREGRTLHIPDMEALSREEGCGGFDPEWVGWNLSPRQRALSWLGIPLLREGRPVGVLVVIRRGQARPYSEADIALLETFAAQAAIAIENTRLFSELRERDERRRQELERASAIQQRLLPSITEGWPGVLEIAHRFRPAVETSGDFYDVLRLTPATEGALPPLQVAVGDVAGKGMSAALVTALARSALRSTAFLPPTAATPANTLRLAGQRLNADVGGGHFVACALGVVEPPGQHNAGPLLRLANAAQVPVLLVRDGAASEIEPGGYRLPLGAQADGAYEDAKVELRAGDVVVFSSDGLVEAPALAAAAVPSHLPSPEKAGELFGFARLATSASRWSAAGASAEEVAAGMWADLASWCGEESHHDDVTLLVLRVPSHSA